MYSYIRIVGMCYKLGTHSCMYFVINKQKACSFTMRQFVGTCTSVHSQCTYVVHLNFIMLKSRIEVAHVCTSFVFCLMNLKCTWSCARSLYT